MVCRFQRRRLLQTGLAFSSLGWWPAARACEYHTANLRITHPWTRASDAGAETAVVCMKFDEVRVTDRLVLLETPVASGAEMGGAQTGETAKRANQPAGVNFLIPADYKAIDAADVARALHRMVTEGQSGVLIALSGELKALGNGAP